jgi:hypothetical protein
MRAAAWTIAALLGLCKQSVRRDLLREGRQKSGSTSLF